MVQAGESKQAACTIAGGCQGSRRCKRSTQGSMPQSTVNTGAYRHLPLKFRPWCLLGSSGSRSRPPSPFLRSFSSPPSAEVADTQAQLFFSEPCHGEGGRASCPTKGSVPASLHKVPRLFSVLSHCDQRCSVFQGCRICCLLVQPLSEEGAYELVLCALCSLYYCTCIVGGPAVTRSCRETRYYMFTL